MTTTTINVPSMSCQHCVKSIHDTVKGISGVESVNVDLDTKMVTVLHDDQVSKSILISAIEDQGYDVVG